MDHAFHSEDGDSKILQKDGILTQCYTASQPRRSDLNIHHRENLKSNRSVLSVIYHENS